MGKTFSAKTTPHMYIPATIAGAKNYVLAAMEDLKAGNPVATSDTPPYGCSVKYKS